ncbi:MAG: SDR family oxidoreductase [Bacteroidetes bacterium]|nr:MAG: SDR family oxidoreductase [Bacteroidota bacterium]
MDLGLKGKIIVVTGGAKGIGAAIARHLAAEGACPVIVDREEQASWELVEELREAGVAAGAYIGELSEPTNCREAVYYTSREYGRIDGLVNNAGINDGIGLEYGSPEEFMTSIRNNLLHYYCMAHYALPALRETQGSIVNISSKCAITGQGHTSAYAAAKGGQLALTREWAVELLKYGIRVNAIIPAEVSTPMYEAWINTFEHPEEKLHRINAKIPLGNRMTTAEEIANMVLFLLSERASHITGQHMYIDGGYVHLDRAIDAIANSINGTYGSLRLK